jgi:hypothetical protein
MATERKRKDDARRVREAGLGVEAHCTAADGCVPEYEAKNLSLWLNYQLARWLVRTGRKGHWKITATISRKA